MRLVVAAFFVVQLALALPNPVHAQQRQLKVLVLHDMEGLAGEDDWRLFSHAYPAFYVKGQRMLVADVNAVIEGLIAAGATTIDVTDGHGSGNIEPDIPLELLNPKAHMVFKDKPFDPYVDLVEPKAYDAVALVGMHAKPGSKGFVAHTSTPLMVQIMNGQSLSEPELIAYSWGRVDVPVIFVSGDDRLKENLAGPMPWVEYVTTKRSTSASTVELFPVDSVHQAMTAAAKRALENLGKMKPLKIKTPVAAAMKALPPGSLEMLKGVPGINYADSTVSFTAADFKGAYDGIQALMQVAGTVGALAVLQDVLRNQPNALELQVQFREGRINRWLDYESGRWKPTPAVPRVQRRYHGDN